MWKKKKRYKPGSESVQHYITALLSYFLQWKDTKTCISERSGNHTACFSTYVTAFLLSQ